MITTNTIPEAFASPTDTNTAPSDRADGSVGDRWRRGSGETGGVATPLTCRLVDAPRGYTVRRIPDQWFQNVRHDRTPRSGDVVLARVGPMGQHTRLHLPDGRRRDLFEGDEVAVVYGNRYASDQFEAFVPETLGPCHLVASGGLAGTVVQSHRSMRRPTGLQPIGLVCRGPGSDSVPVNVADASLEPLSGPVPVPVIAVAGTAMNAGKTTSAAALTKGLVRAGYRVGYVKVTGTSAGGDPWLLADSGARVTLDCVDAGHVTTYRLRAENLVRISATLLGHAAKVGVDVILAEIADGVLQVETAALLETEYARRSFSGVVFAASDAMGAGFGSAWLTKRGHRLLGLTGTVTNSPLQIAEARGVVRGDVIETSQLAVPMVAHGIFEKARAVI